MGRAGSFPQWEGGAPLEWRASPIECPAVTFFEIQSGSFHYPEVKARASQGQQWPFLLLRDPQPIGTADPANPWGCSSVGRAPALHAGGQGFDSPQLHHHDPFSTPSPSASECLK